MKPVQLIFELLKQWPCERTKCQKSAAFKSTLDATYRLLREELGRLGVNRAVVQAECGYEAIRNDGMLSARANIRPAIIVSFTIPAKGNQPERSLSYPCDTFSYFGDNLRAIALALESLRKIDRYGVTRDGEQYKGWQQLPSPNGDHWTKEDALSFLRGILGPELFAVFKNDGGQLVRRAEIKTHPDRGGNPDDFKKVQQARKLLLG